MKEVEAKRTKLQIVKTMKRYPVFEFISFCMITSFFHFWFKFRKHFELSYFSHEKQRTDNLQLYSEPSQTSEMEFFANIIDPFQPSVAFHTEKSHLFCREKQMTGFYM